MNEPSLSGMERVRKQVGNLRARVKGFLPFGLGMLAMLLALILYNYFFPVDQITEREMNEAIVNAMASATPRPSDAVLVNRIIQPSLVAVQAEFANGGENGEAGHALGTGVIIDDFGDILTSLHVVKGAEKLSITFADGTQSGGFVVIEQPENDIAVLRAFVLPELFVPATIGSSEALDVGDDVFVVGHPFGLYGSMSAGVISGFNREFQPPSLAEPILGLIQFDAATNPGNSGGPLLDRRGHVIGIVTGIVNPTDDSFFVGIGFAVPINTAAGGLGSPPY